MLKVRSWADNGPCDKKVREGVKKSKEVAGQSAGRTKVRRSIEVIAISPERKRKNRRVTGGRGRRPPGTETFLIYKDDTFFGKVKLRKIFLKRKRNPVIFLLKQTQKRL
jgi:hypothetical protein